MTGASGPREVVGHVVVTVQGDVAAAMNAAGIHAVAINSVNDPRVDDLVAIFDVTIWPPIDGPLLQLADDVAAELHRRDVTPRWARSADIGHAALELLSSPDGISRVKEVLAAAVRWLPVIDDSLQVASTLSHSPDGADPSTPEPALRERLVDPRFRRRSFPTHLLPPLLRALVVQSARAIGCSQTMVGVPLLGVLAGCIGNRAVMRIKAQWYVPAVIWVAIIEESGQHKTPALDAVSAPLREREASIIKNYKSRQEAYKNEVELWNATPKAERGDRPTEPRQPQRLLISDTTTEAVAERLDASPLGMLVWSDELAAWFKSFDIYRGGQGPDAQRWLSAHDAKEWFIDRKGADPIAIPKAAVSIVGGIQPDILREVLTQEHFRNGLAARLLMAMPARRQKHWSEAEVDEVVRAAYQAMLVRLLEMRPQQDLSDGALIPRVLTMAPDAKAAYVKWYEHHAERQNDSEGAEAALLAKLEGGACRLALVLHLARVASGDPSADPDVVDLQSLSLGIALAEWFAHEGLRIYAVLSESEADRGRRHLLETIHQRLKGRATVRDVMRKGPRRLRSSADDAQRAIDDLVQQGLVHWEASGPGPRGGRPTDVLVVDVDLGDEAEDPGDTTPGEAMPVVSPPPTGRPSSSSQLEVVSPPRWPLADGGECLGNSTVESQATAPPPTPPGREVPHPLVTQPPAAPGAGTPAGLAESCLAQAVHSGRESDIRTCWDVLARHTSASYANEVELDARQDQRGADAHAA